MNNLQVFNNEQFGSIRILTIDGEPWFVVADVCKCLEMSNPTVTLDRLDADEKAKFNLGLAGGDTNCVNEPGLYTLVLGSRKPEAKMFKRWITHDVIPSIRKCEMADIHKGSVMNITNISTFTSGDRSIDWYEENGALYLNLEQCARGLGFVITQIINDKEYTNIRWDRVNKYLTDFGFTTSGKKFGKNDYVPENIFYRLAMKAKNEVAEHFQAWVADEVIPSIQKTGSYVSSEKAREFLFNPDTIIEIAQNWKMEKEKNAVLTADC